MRPLFRALSPGGARGRLSVLIFHRVSAAADPLLPDEFHAPRFDAVCKWIARWFQILDLEEAIQRLMQRTLPERAMAITFDDGYADNREIAVPILQRHGLKATFFVATAFLDGGRMWNDTIIEAVRRSTLSELDLRDVEGEDLGMHRLSTTDDRRRALARIIDCVKYLPRAKRDTIVAALVRRAKTALPGGLMMTSSQVASLPRVGMKVGAHTHTHPILADLSSEDALDEMLLGKRRLEELVEAPVRLFAYPNGRPGRDYTRETVALARDAGFDAAFTTALGVARVDSDRFQIPRFTPWDRTRTRFALRLAQTLCRSEEVALPAR